MVKARKVSSHQCTESRSQVDLQLYMNEFGDQVSKSGDSKASFSSRQGPVACAIKSFMCRCAIGLPLLAGFPASEPWIWCFLLWWKTLVSGGGGAC